MKVFLKALLFGCSFSYIAQCVASGGTYSGAGLTTGPTSNHFYMTSAVENPAMSSLLVDNDEEWRISYLPNFSASVEFGEVNDFIDELDDLIDFLDDANIFDLEVSDTLDRFNNVIEQMGEDGYVKTDLSVHAPFLPLVHKSDFWGGSFSVDLSYGVQVGARVLDSPIEIDFTAIEVTTATSLYLKSGIETKFSLGYSRYFPSQAEWFNDFGKLYIGAKINLLSIDLSKQVIPLVSIAGRDVESIIRDEYNSNVNSNFQVGFDVGFIFDTEKVRFGLTIENINSLEFSYGTVGRDCDQRPLGFSRDSCTAAAFFVDTQGRIAANEVHKRTPLTRVDTLIKLTDYFNVSAVLDLNEYQDLSAFDQQWLHLATSLNTSSFWFPSLRLGYKKNLAEFGTSSLGFGVSLFKYVNFDIEYGLETVTVEAENFPRRLGFAISVEERF